MVVLLRTVGTRSYGCGLVVSAIRRLILRCRRRSGQGGIAKRDPVQTERLLRQPLFQLVLGLEPSDLREQRVRTMRRLRGERPLEVEQNSLVVNEHDLAYG